MIQEILELFTTEQKAAAMLNNSIIELIFATLFIGFMVTFIVHLALYMRLRKIRNYVKETNRLDVEPLKSFKEQFDKKQDESVKIETFVQEKFSGWRVLNIPVVSLIKMVQMTISVFILLGVLGTFIGLTISLGNIHTNEEELVENVAGVLSGIDVAFYTSIVGMSFSLVMTVLVKTLNTEYMLTDIMLTVETLLEGNEKNGMNRLIHVSETINQSILGLQTSNQKSLQNIEQAFSGFQEYTSGLQQSAKDLAAFNDGLSSNLQDFQEIFRQVEKLMNGFGEGTRELNKNFNALFAYFKQTDRKNERIATAFEQTYEKVQEATKAQVEATTHFEESVEELKQFTSTILQEQEIVHRTLDNITEKSEQLVEKMGLHHSEFKQIFGSDLSSKLTGIKTYLGELAKGFNQLGDSIIQLPTALEVINQTQTEHRHLLADRFQELKEFNRSFSEHLTNHTQESAAFEKHILKASSTYEQMGLKNNQLLNEMTNVINQMNSAFSRRENVLESSVGILKDTLTNYVANLESGLGDRLDKVVRGIGDSVYAINDGIKREFAEIRRMTEDIQQSNMRSIQQLLQELGREFQLLNRQFQSISQQRLMNNANSNVGLRQNDY